jgi:Uma2 family endonuclease
MAAFREGNPTMAISHDVYWFTEPIVLRGDTLIENASRDAFFDFCAANRKMRIERTADAELVLLPATGNTTSQRLAQLLGQLGNWSIQDGTGIGVGGTAGYWLPNGAMRQPRMSWLRCERWLALSDEDREKLPPLAPDFLLEIRSEFDRLEFLRDKMREYAENGVRLGWLIDPVDRRVEVYRPGATPEIHDHPTQVSGDPELPGFVLDLTKIW